MYGLYRKVTVNSHFSIYSTHFCSASTKLFNLHGFCFRSQQQCHEEVVVYYNNLVWSSVVPGYFQPEGWPPSTGIPQVGNNAEAPLSTVIPRVGNAHLQQNPILDSFSCTTPPKNYLSRYLKFYFFLRTILFIDHAIDSIFIRCCEWTNVLPYSHLTCSK